VLILELLRSELCSGLAELHSYFFRVEVNAATSVVAVFSICCM